MTRDKSWPLGVLVNVSRFQPHPSIVIICIYALGASGDEDDEPNAARPYILEHSMYNTAS